MPIPIKDVTPNVPTPSATKTSTPAPKPAQTTNQTTNGKIPTSNTAPKVAIKKITKSPKYTYVGKGFMDTLREIFPWTFRATKKTGYILGYMFLAVLILGLVNYAYTSDFLKGDLTTPITIGWPWTFLEFSLENPEAQPVHFTALIGTVLLYTFLAYAIDILINLIWDAITTSRKERGIRPEVFKNIKKQSFADKATSKIFKKDKPENPATSAAKPAPVQGKMVSSDKA